MDQSGCVCGLEYYEMGFGGGNKISDGLVMVCLFADYVAL